MLTRSIAMSNLAISNLYNNYVPLKLKLFDAFANLGRP